MTDGAATGLSHALWLLGYLIGATPILLATAILILAAALAGPWIVHRRRVANARREARRYGRTPGANTPTGY